ncbi:TPA: hypothetical protein KN142_001438 [Clostridioides difficile]|nr:hypothetical protein [Clostridioides difficile]HBF4062185.1 hypothetical protein [Clostridioides difficile]
MIGNTLFNEYVLIIYYFRSGTYDIIQMADKNPSNNITRKGTLLSLKEAKELMPPQEIDKFFEECEKVRKEFIH